MVPFLFIQEFWKVVESKTTNFLAIQLEKISINIKFW